MAQFTNQARLIYNDTTYLSNIAVGEITESLSVGKTAAVKSYISGDPTYTINMKTAAPPTGLASLIRGHTNLAQELCIR